MGEEKRVRSVSCWLLQSHFFLYLSLSHQPAKLSALAKLSLNTIHILDNQKLSTNLWNSRSSQGCVLTLLDYAMDLVAPSVLFRLMTWAQLSPELNVSMSDCWKHRHLTVSQAPQIQHGPRFTSSASHWTNKRQSETNKTVVWKHHECNHSLWYYIFSLTFKQAYDHITS